MPRTFDLSAESPASVDQAIRRAATRITGGRDWPPSMLARRVMDLLPRSVADRLVKLVVR